MLALWMDLNDGVLQGGFPLAVVHAYLHPHQGPALRPTEIIDPTSDLDLYVAAPTIVNAKGHQGTNVEMIERCQALIQSLGALLGQFGYNPDPCNKTGINYADDGSRHRLMTTTFAPFIGDKNGGFSTLRYAIRVSVVIDLVKCVPKKKYAGVGSKELDGRDGWSRNFYYYFFIIYFFIFCPPHAIPSSSLK